MMPLPHISTREWEKARTALAFESTGYKLPHNAPTEVGEAEGFNYSFMRFADDLILAIMPGNKEAVIGQGRYGQVKYAFDERGGVWAVKIEDLNSTLQRREAEILVDLNLAEQKQQALNGSHRFYTPIKYLGQTFYGYLKKNKAKLSDKAKLNIGIQLFLHLHHLHSGQLSSSGTPYAHLDLKPENMVINKRGKLTFIDYGCANIAPGEYPDGLKGTPIYLPPEYIHFTRKALDVFALKRVFYLPVAFHVLNPRRPVGSGVKLFRRNTSALSLFCDEAFYRLKLGRYFDTGIDGFAVDETLRNKDALFYASVLVLARLGLVDDYHLLETYHELSVLVVNLYLKGECSLIKNIFRDEWSCKLSQQLMVDESVSMLDKAISSSFTVLAVEYFNRYYIPPSDDIESYKLREADFLSARRTFVDLLPMIESLDLHYFVKTIINSHRALYQLELLQTCQLTLRAPGYFKMIKTLDIDNHEKLNLYLGLIRLKHYSQEDGANRTACLWAEKLHHAMLLFLSRIEKNKSPILANKERFKLINESLMHALSFNGNKVAAFKTVMRHFENHHARKVYLPPLKQGACRKEAAVAERSRQRFFLPPIEPVSFAQKHSPYKRSDYRKYY